MSDIDPVDLRMSSRLVPSGKALDHVSMYGTDLSDEETAENMYQMFVNLPAEVITQGVSNRDRSFYVWISTSCYDITTLAKKILQYLVNISAFFVVSPTDAQYFKF